jgi:hypothetical protein
MGFIRNHNGDACAIEWTDLDISQLKRYLSSTTRTELKFRLGGISIIEFHF